MNKRSEPSSHNGLVYSPNEMARILATITLGPKPNDRAYFSHALQGAGEILSAERALTKSNGEAPSARQRRWLALAMAADKVRKDFAGMREDGLLGLDYEVACQPEPGKAPRLSVTTPSHRDFEIAADAALMWLADAARASAIQAGRHKGRVGGKRADQALHDFIYDVSALYWRVASAPASPWRDRDEAGDIHGELVDLLAAALPPLGVKLSREAIYSAWRRAKEGKAWPPDVTHINLPSVRERFAEKYAALMLPLIVRPRLK